MMYSCSHQLQIGNPSYFRPKAPASRANSTERGCALERTSIDTPLLVAALAEAVLYLAVNGCVRSATPLMASDEVVTANYSAEQETNVQQRQQALLDRWSSPIAKVIVTRDDIAQFRDRRASDILRRVPGLFMGSPVGGRGRSARIRGLGTQYTQILVNGERISGSGEKRQFELDRIPADMIERIEVIKSPSAEYSSDAVAGIVNVILREAPDPRVQELLDELRRGREPAQTDRP